MSHMTYLEASVVGLIQGVTELFPVSSLGHNVLIPALIGGSWASDLNVAAPESPYLAFIVGLHVATAIALLIYFWRDWVRIIGGFFSSIRRPAGSRPGPEAGLDDHPGHDPGRPGRPGRSSTRSGCSSASRSRPRFFLIVNGLILYCGERFRTRSRCRPTQAVAAERDGSTQAVVADAGAAARRPPGRGPPAPASGHASVSGRCARRRSRWPCGPTGGWPRSATGRR